MENKSLYKEMSNQLRKIRRDKDLTLETVAEQLSLHRETIRRYESDCSKISIDTLIAMLNFYGVEVTIFFENIYGKLPLIT